MIRNTTNLEGRARAELGVQLLEAINRSAPIEEIIALIEHGADVNIQDNNNNGLTPLHHACYKNNANLATFLIEHGADVNIQDNDGQTPLYHVCHENNTELATLLIQRGADVNIQNDFGEIPLHPACNNNNLQLATLLIQHGADINTRDNDGLTSLYHACYRNNTGLTALLIEHGADINIRSNYGDAPLSFACLMNNHEIIPLLLNAGADVDLSLLKAFVRDYERDQIDDIINNQTLEHLNLHLRGDANIETIGILDMLYFPSRYDGILHLIGNDNNEIHLQFEQECLLK